MRRARAITTAVASLVLLLAACGPAAEDSPPAGGEVDDGAPTDEDAVSDDDDMNDEAPENGPADLDEFVELALADAADDRGVAEEEIEVVRAEEVEWPDGARGCPEEGEMYTQAIVPGYLVVLEIDGEQHHYHGGEGERPFRCDDPQDPVGS
jgi:hypothetical protein